MTRKLIIFEDELYENFYPLTYLRPVHMLRPGIRFLHERISDSFPEYQPHFFCRPEIADLTRQMCDYPVNTIDEAQTDEIIFINARLKISTDLASALMAAGKNVYLTCRGSVVAIKVIGDLSALEKKNLKIGDLGEFAAEIKKRSELVEIEVGLYNFLWDLVADIDRTMAEDFEFLRPQIELRIKQLELMIKEHSVNDVYPGVHFINPERIYVSSDAEILPGAVLDGSKGPIFIGGRARIEPYTYVIGPLYLGKESILVGGRIAGSSIGPVCRIGGELEESIIQGYTNKYHAGFIGHSYVGEWVNFGAMTTNSDLKNNYAAVHVTVGGKERNSGLLKVGAFIGDFTKTAIGTLLNTGLNVGVCCNLVGLHIVTDREIPSFTWMALGKKSAYEVDKALEVIEKTMSRRDKSLTPEMKKRLLELGPKAGAL
ncbi:putative Nucleoside-diphosphate-sugar pyrophosphorylase [Candidatus Zixiibacteriota bacterium]|nr:putative Nucleoside-diphosphate-sugar pyrophosphorylase [candidate division Zixibacteria bacterium]